LRNCVVAVLIGIVVFLPWGRDRGIEMNILLWVLQIALAVKFLSVAYTHALRPDPEKMRRGNERFGATARPLLILIGLGALLGAVGLVLPAATGTLTWLTPWAAMLLALMMLPAVGFHAACREKPKSVVAVVLVALCAFVAYGRWTIAPF
jgi:VIT1/CCC1 family predicted Fe2+/Mn2+ transporter